MDIAIYGAGGSGRELEEMLVSYPELRGLWDDIIFIDDTKEQGTFRGYQVMPYERIVELYSPESLEIAIAVGEPASRELLLNKVKNSGYKLATVVCPLAKISKSAYLGEGVIIIEKNVLVSEDAHIGDNVWVNANAIIGHDVRIGNNCQISSFAFIGGRTRVDENTYIGAAAAIRENIQIGHDTIISMGAIVLKDVRDYKIVMGNPAREIAENKDRRVFK